MIFICLDNSIFNDILYCMKKESANEQSTSPRLMDSEFAFQLGLCMLVFPQRLSLFRDYSLSNMPYNVCCTTLHVHMYVPFVCILVPIHKLFDSQMTE